MRPSNPIPQIPGLYIWGIDGRNADPENIIIALIRHLVEPLFRLQVEFINETRVRPHLWKFDVSHRFKMNPLRGDLQRPDQTLRERLILSEVLGLVGPDANMPGYRL
jgi:hypothetical protein